MASGSVLIDGPSVAGGAGSIYDAMGSFGAADWAVLEARNEGYCPVAGCAISASGTAGKLDMTAGVASFDKIDLTVAAVTAFATTITTLASGLSSGQALWVACEVDNTGTLNLNSGSAATVTTAGGPLKPTPTSGRVVVAWLYVPFGATAVDALLTNSNAKAKILEARQLTPMQPLHTEWPYVVSGCTWTGDALGSTKAASMAAGVVVIAGKRLYVAAVTARTFTASKDTYVDFQDNGDGTASITYTEVTNNAASPALPASGTVLNTFRNAIIITGASNIASATLTDGTVGAINQGSTFSVLPIAASVPYCVTDSLGNLIFNSTPQPKLIGYRQIVADVTTTATPTVTAIAALAAPCIIPAGLSRRVRIKVVLPLLGTTNALAGGNVLTYIYVAGSQIQYAGYRTPNTTGTYIAPVTAEYVGRLGPGTTTPDARMSQGNAGTLTAYGATNAPASISIELI